MSIIREYYALAKPGIIRGNLVTTFAGFLLASNNHIDIGPLITILLGTSFVIACGCVLNNYIDRGIDAHMHRTKKRALVTGTISGNYAIIYGIILGLIGFTVLAAFTNLLTVVVGLLGLFFYVVVYGIAKRRSVHGTVIGSISGALPPVAGYTAAANHIDGGAALLFLILTCWQMPHFYSIAVYRYRDYAAAGLPVLPVQKGMRATKIQILSYTVLFIIAALSLGFAGYTGPAYIIVMSLIGLGWLYLGIKGFRATDDARWARNMFGYSLLVITALSLMISLEALYTWYMLIVFHVVVALTSLGLSTSLFFAPSTFKLKATYTLSALTLTSGTYLVWTTQAHILQACMSGLIYLAAIALGIIAARNKLASAKVQAD